MSDIPHDSTPDDEASAGDGHGAEPYRAEGTPDFDERQYDEMVAKGQTNLAAALYPAVPARRKRRNTFTIQPADRPFLKVACDLAKKAAKAAKSAGAKAECTVGVSEAQTLEGYSDENILRIDAAVGTELELASGGRHALMTGLRLYAGSLGKLGDTELELLSDDVATQSALSHVAHLLRVFNHEQEPQTELALDTPRADVPDPTDVPPPPLPDDDEDGPTFDPLNGDTPTG